MSKLEVELTPEQDTLLQQNAQRQGVTIAEYARALIIASLTNGTDKKLTTENPSTSLNIMELHGLGAEIWKDKNGNLIDAQEYVTHLRQEWESQ